MILEHYTSLRYVIWNVPFFVKMDVYKGYGWLFLRKTRKGRETSPASGDLNRKLQLQAARMSLNLPGRSPSTKAGLSIPLKHPEVLPNTKGCISIFHTVPTEEHTHLHPQNNREINEDDCNSQSLVSAAMERSNKLRLWILGRDFKLAL